jgi:hypothetical protein
MTGPAAWLSFAAAPTFGAMALLTATVMAPPDMLCASGAGSPLTGMTAMYLLMTAFHASPWLKRLERVWRPTTR